MDFRLRLTGAAGAMALATLTATSAGAAPPPGYYLGADLSYANEMDDCGAVYRVGGKPVDEYRIVKAAGANLVRIRIWNDATWTRYSNLADVERSIARAKAAGLQVLLDFHYSDDWADGDKQIAPKAWAGLPTDEQAKALYRYTYDTLAALNAKGLSPDLVQVGNEINREIVSSLQDAKKPIDWTRDALLINSGIRAVRDAAKASGKPIRVMLHIAQPENVEPWFAAAEAAGVRDFDLIGISYYRKWSTEGLPQLGDTIRRLRARYKADVMVVETAYPWTLDGADSSPNLLGQDSLIPGYPATPEGQEHYLTDLTQDVIDAGGVGVVYWEPTWISTKCKTRWGTGSNWENATLFDFDGRALPGLRWLEHAYRYPHRR